MTFRRLLALALGLAAFPVFASYSFTDGEIAGHFGSTYSTPITICAYIKYSNHPESNESAVNFGSSPSSTTDSIYLGVPATADEYREQSIDTSVVYDAALYDASTGEYDGAWVPICVVESSTDRDIYVESTSNHGTDSTNHTFNDAFDEISIGRRLGGDSQPWTGLEAEICVYDGTMSGADMTSYMTGTACSSLSGAANVVGYYSLSTDNTGTGMDADESGNGGPTLTEAGTLAYSADHPTITSAPTFTVDPARDSCSTSGTDAETWTAQCTYTYTAAAAGDTLYIEFLPAGASAPADCNAIIAGTGAHGTANETTTGTSDSITITATDHPYFPSYDLWYCLYRP